MAALLAVVLAAAPVKLATADWTFSGVDKAVGEALLDRFATQLAEHGVQVTTQRDIAQVLGLERQKQLTGCTNETSSCLAELAGALGVDGVLTGSVVKVGTSFTVTLRAVAAGTGLQLASATNRVRSEEAVQDWLDEQARVLAERITRALRAEAPPAAVTTEAPTPPRRWLPVGLTAASAAVLAGGAVCFGLSRGEAAALSANPVRLTTEEQIHGARTRGEALERAGAAMIVVGAVAAAAGVAWMVLGKGGPAVAVAPVSGGGAGISVSGALP